MFMYMDIGEKSTELNVHMSFWGIIYALFSELRGLYQKWQKSRKSKK